MTLKSQICVKSNNLCLLPKISIESIIVKTPLMMIRYLLQIQVILDFKMINYKSKKKILIHIIQIDFQKLPARNLCKTIPKSIALHIQKNPIKIFK